MNRRWFAPLTAAENTIKYTILQELIRAIKSKSLTQGTSLLPQITAHCMENDPEVQNLLVQMCSACGSLDQARSLFNTIPTPQLTSWNMLITAYGQAGKTQQALALFKMLPTIEDSSRSAMVVVFAKSGDAAGAKSMFDSTNEPSTVAWNTMISLYAHNGQVKEAESTFKAMQRPTVVTHNAMISGYGYSGRVADAKDMFDRMQKRSTVTYNAMVTAFAQNAHVEQAKELFDQMTEKSVVSWNTLIAGYDQNGRPREALQLFRSMDLEGMQPNKFTYCSVLDACASLTSCTEGRIVHSSIDEGLRKDIHVGNSICNMYGKCGQPELARETFLEMPYHNVVSWTSVIAAYAQNGYSPEAVEVFRIMVQVGEEPNEVTLINTLSACSHGGLYDDGCQIFSSMTLKEYQARMVESHYICMVDLLGRAGYLDAAETLVTNMPHRAGGEVAWTSLLSACKTYRDMKRATRVAEKLFDLDTSPSSKDPAPYVMLSNIYANAGKSVITVRGRTNEFYSSGQTHPRKVEIYKELQHLNEEIEKAGYVPGVSTRRGETEEDDVGSSYHSEKLALAFGVITTPDGAPLCIVKNLRVCSDCHNAMKHLSKFLKRKIALRDTTRFHHFQNGFCSCRDYW